MAFGDLLLHSPNESVRHGTVDPACAERVVPLLVGELVQPLAEPANVRDFDVVEQRSVTSAVFESHFSLVDAADERGGFEHADVAPRRVENPGPPECLAEVPGD